MARGKVVLATDWSGNTDFMNAHNALPVDYRLVTLQADAGPYRKGERWAEPALDDAVIKLRLLVADVGLRVRLGRRARQDVMARLTPIAVAELQKRRLAWLMHAQHAASQV